MEDYIFLLIAIVLSIFGAINKKKKKNEAQMPIEEEADTPRNFFMDQLLGDDFLDEPMVEEVKPKKKVKPVFVKDQVASIPTASTFKNYRSNFKSGLPDRLQRGIVTSVKRQPVEEKSPEADNDNLPGYMEDFSLRKAFVYSEILNRKYE